MQNPCYEDLKKSQLRFGDWDLRFVWGLRFGICGFVTVSLVATAANISAPQPFHFPTANHALFEKGGEEKFFAGTAGNDWTTGMFGCVRSGGWKIHEGLDIRCLERDK